MPAPEISSAGTVAGLAKAVTPDPQSLLTPAQAANRLSVSRRWLYRNKHKLPFARRLSRKVLRFDEAGLERWLKQVTP